MNHPPVSGLLSSTEGDPTSRSGALCAAGDQGRLYPRTPHPLLHKYRDTTWENGYNESFNGKLRDELLNGEIFCSLAEAAVLVEQWRREYNTVRPHSACGGFPPAPEAIKPSPWFLRMPVLHGPPQVLGLT